MRGVMADPTQRKTRERHSGPPCLHYPQKYKTESRHQAALASKRRSDVRRRAAKSPKVFRSHAYPVKRRIKLILSAIKQRCRHHARYAGRGIQNFLTFADLQFLWKRDNAQAMQRPSIDRRNNDGHYSLDNCRFIELYDNISLGTKIRESLRHQKERAA